MVAKWSGHRPGNHIKEDLLSDLLIYNIDHHLTLHNFCVAIVHTKRIPANLNLFTVTDFSHIMQTFESSFVGDKNSSLDQH